jgi:hypothetical protein
MLVEAPKGSVGGQNNRAAFLVTLISNNLYIELCDNSRVICGVSHFALRNTLKLEFVFFRRDQFRHQSVFRSCFKLAI